MDILKKIFIFFIFILAMLIAIRTFFLGTYPDFSVYYFGSRNFLIGNNPYIRSPESFSNYVYPPFVLLLFIPFLLLPFPSASLFFLLFSFLALFLGVYFCLKALKKLSWSSYLFFISLSLFAFPTKFTLGMGQVNLIIFLLLSSCFYLLHKNKMTKAGVVLGFSLAIKIFPLLLLVYFFLKKQTKIMLVSFGVVLLLYTITAALVGIPLYTLFIKNVFPGIASSYQSDYYNQALSGFFARLPLAPSVGMMMKNVVCVLFTVLSFFLIYQARKKKELADISFAIAITLSLLVNPFSWQHHFVWLILPFIITFFSLKHTLDFLFLGLSYLLIAVNFEHPHNLPLLIQSHVLFGTILLWLIQGRLLLKNNHA